MHIIVVDDHPIVLDGTKTLLESVDGWHVSTVTEASSIVETIAATSPDLIMLDINLGKLNGVTIAEQIKQRFEVPIILYSGYDMEDYYDLLVTEKVDGLLSKTASKDTVLAAVRAVLRGDVYVPRSFLQYIRRQHVTETQYALSEREVTILSRIARGDTNKAIAADLGLSQRTVEHTLTKIFATLNVYSRAEAVAKAKDLRLIR